MRIILVMLCGELVVIITLSCLSVSMAGNGRAVGAVRIINYKLN